MDECRLALPSLRGCCRPIPEHGSPSGGESGASVVVDRDRQRYAKLVSSARVAELAAERDRTSGSTHTAIPSARVLGWREYDAGACLVTQAVLGCRRASSTLRSSTGVASVVAVGPSPAAT